MRSNCVRCGTVLRRHPRRSAEPPPGAHFRRHGAVRRAVARHADEGLDRRHRARDHPGIRARSSWSIAACGRWRWRSPSPRRSHPSSSSPARSMSWSASRCAGCRPTCAACSWWRAAWAPGRCWRCCCSACSWPTPSSATWSPSSSVPPSMRLGLLTIVLVWAEAAFDPDAVWEEIERRGQTHAPMPAVAPLDFRPGAAGCEACGLVCVPAEGDGNCPRCGSAVHERKPASIVRTWAFVIAAAILYIPANVYPVLTVIQLGAGAAQHHPGRRRGAAGLADVSAGAAWCSSPASWCRCSS